jgi:hypothetical protein
LAKKSLRVELNSLVSLLQHVPYKELAVANFANVSSFFVSVRWKLPFLILALRTKRKRTKLTVVDGFGALVLFLATVALGLLFPRRILGFSQREDWVVKPVLELIHFTFICFNHKELVLVL